MHVATPVYLTSVVKPYTATVILQLWERGRLALDEPMATYLPPALIGGLHRLDGVDHTATITVRQLLGHTSGLPDYFLGKPKGGVSYAEQIMTGDVSYTISDVADRVRDMTPYFPPQDPSAKRQRARYSDTNYQLLGAIVEAVTGLAFHQVVDEQILRPLDLHATAFAGHPRRRTAEVPATMWAGKTPLEIPQAMRSLGPDGGLIGTAAEAITFLRALITGRLFERSDTFQLMLRRFNRLALPRDRTAVAAPGWPIQYGLGIKRFRVPRLFSPGRRPITLLGHSGASGSWLFYCPEFDVYLAGTVDQTTAAGLPYRFSPRLLRAIPALTRPSGITHSP